MRASHPLALSGDHASPALAERALARTVYAFIWMALKRHRLPAADCDDLAQEALLKAHIHQATYDAARGNWQQWLYGIVRNEVRMLRRRAERQRRCDDDELCDVPCNDPTPEESVSRHQLAELANQMWQFVPDEERRAVILRAFEGLTFREIAERERIAHATAQARYERGMATLRLADEEAARGVPFPLPASALAFFGPGADETGPPPNAFERAWRALAPHLGAGHAPEPELPTSGARRTAPGQHRRRGPRVSPRTRRRWLRSLLAVGPIVGILLGACPVSESGGDPAQPRPLAATTAGPPRATPTAAQGTTVLSFVAPASAAEAPATAAAGAPAAAATTPITPARAARRTAPPIGETVLIDRARDALWAQDVSAAAQAVADHIRLYPRGQHLALRERMRARLCARHNHSPMLAKLCP